MQQCHGHVPEKTKEMQATVWEGTNVDGPKEHMNPPLCTSTLSSPENQTILFGARQLVLKVADVHNFISY